MPKTSRLVDKVEKNPSPRAEAHDRAAARMRRFDQPSRVSRIVDAIRAAILTVDDGPVTNR